MSKRYNVVAICGSMSLWPQMLEAAATLARQGTVALLPTPCPDGDRELLARLHERRIDLADSVLVVGEPGLDTQEELVYAVVNGKPVHYTEDRPCKRVDHYFIDAATGECVECRNDAEDALGWCANNGHLPTANFGRDGGPCAACGKWTPLNV
jgi:hypothetical protein